MADGEVRLFPNWNDAINYGKEVQHRATEPTTPCARPGTWRGRSTKGPLGALKDRGLRTAGLYLHAVDRLTTTWAWTAFHNEAVAKGMEPFSREAIDYANGKTQDVMPVHDIETAAPILTNRQVGGFLIMHGFKNTLYNMRQDALAKSAKDFHLARRRAVRRRRRQGRRPRRAPGRHVRRVRHHGQVRPRVRAAGRRVQGAVAGPGLLGRAVGGHALIGGLGEPLAKWMVGGKVTKRDFTSYGNPGLAAVNKVYELLGNLVNEAARTTRRSSTRWRPCCSSGGVPSRPVRTSAEHVYEMLMGENYDAVDSSVGDSAGRMVYTEKQWESIKRSLTPDED
jgi:hypothetical protein